MRNALPVRRFFASKLIAHRLVIIGLCSALLTCGLLIVGCNTVNGLGQDIEKGGQKLQSVSGTQEQEW